jgi:hypothetical protein
LPDFFALFSPPGFKKDGGKGRLAEKIRIFSPESYHLFPLIRTLPYGHP